MKKENVCKKCRREGIKLFLKGDRCQSPKCALNKRNYPPGMHSSAFRKLSGYGLQLREKQKTKSIYGLSERQFKKYYNEAVGEKGDTREILMQFLELRLDNIICRLGFASSRRQSRSLVSHDHFLVNNKKVNIPSYRLKEKDKIEIKKQSISKDLFTNILKKISKADIPSWLKLDSQKMKCEILRLPKRDEIKNDINEQLIIEYYSK